MRQSAIIEMNGYLAKDGELRSTRDGRPVLGLSMAYTRSRRNQQTQQYEDVGETLWARFALWDDVAQHFADKLTKGTPVRVKGIPELRLWEKDGRSGVNLEIQFAEVAVVAEVPKHARDAGAPQQPTAEAEAWATPGNWDDTPF